MKDDFTYIGERFADIQMLRYRLNGFGQLPLKRKELIYYLSQATLFGRDIIFDQCGRYNLLIRKTLEAIYVHFNGDRRSEDFQELAVYLKRVWFSNGIYHHYGCDKFTPGFSSSFFRHAVAGIEPTHLPLRGRQTAEDLCDILTPVMFDPDILPKRVNKTDGEDLVMTSACNYYENVTQREAEEYYAAMRDANAPCPPPYGLNTTLVKEGGLLKEIAWKEGGRYGAAIKQIVRWLEKAASVACNDRQRHAISLLVDFYRTGDLRLFNDFCVEWVEETDASVDFINGFIEVYGDPLGIKGSWEGLVEYRDQEATHRIQLISDNAQWFEDHSPIDSRFRKPHVKGVTANVICAAMLGGDEYPSTAIGINLPNADWIRAAHGSKSITIGNITEAYNKAAEGSGFREEFIADSETIGIIDKYGEVCDALHTDLHECLGHGSGQLLPDADPDALKAYGNTIEEARADLFALYYIADKKLMELGLTPDGEAYKSQYYTYMLNGLLTQLARIKPGRNIEEAHMRDRALIAHWCYEKGKAHNTVELFRRDGKTFMRINDYPALRKLFAQLLAEIQRIKSEGDFAAARSMVETYAVTVDRPLHEEILGRYAKLGIAPYKGFINPVLRPATNDKGEITDINVDYTEEYDQQMLRYSRDYATLI